MKERTAIRLCLKHRDPAGFEFLVEQYKREAFYHAQALLGNEADAADACQERLRKPLARCLDWKCWVVLLLRIVLGFAGVVSVEINDQVVATAWLWHLPGLVCWI